MPKVRTTKRDALVMFQEIKELIGNDKIALSQAWNDYTGRLMKDGIISEWQYKNWVNPF